MSDSTAEGIRPATAGPNPVDVLTSPTNIPRHGHEPSRIAQPSTFLLPRGQNRAMQDKPLTAIDKDQLSGLVSGLYPSIIGLFGLTLWHFEKADVEDPARLTCFDLAECNSGFPQDSDEL